MTWEQFRSEVEHDVRRACVSSPVKETVAKENLWLQLGLDIVAGGRPANAYGTALRCSSATIPH